MTHVTTHVIYVDKDVFDELMSVIRSHRPIAIKYEKSGDGIPSIIEVEYHMKTKEGMAILTIDNQHWECELSFRRDDGVAILYDTMFLSYFGKDGLLKQSQDLKNRREAYVCTSLKEKAKIVECINMWEYVDAVIRIAQKIVEDIEKSQSK